jgi:imidazole glycerol-phosphate synthase subunit HisH
MSALRTPTIAVLDYGMGNRRSVQKALQHLGAEAAITNDHDRLRAADGLVVPGVGAFPRAMHNLGELGLDELIRERAAAQVPVLGICLGMQLLFDHSEELVSTSGLGLIRGEVSRLRTDGLRIPHIGWNEVSFLRPCALTEGLPAGGCAFYHVHSLAARPSDPADVAGCTEYGERFATIVAHENVFGVQFHPEKSSTPGLKMLDNFARLCLMPEAATSAAAAGSGA